ncbi:MAG: putative aminohydrolase SsnA [Lachnospiraceae bacterium]|nr:putative aminohydrolase SsnA [Lachnospiraceae bacterium]
MLLIANGTVITLNQDMPLINDGAVVTEGEKILAVGGAADLKAMYPQADYVDAHGGLIMPGFINVHTHIYSGLARGLAIAGNDPQTFLEVLEGTWWNIDRHLTMDGTRASAYATVLDCIRNGVTTIFDHHASFCEIPGSLFAIRDVVKELGIRSCLCYEVSDRDGGEKLDQSIKENADFARWAAAEQDDMIKAMFGGHALFTLSDSTFEKMAEANDGLTGFHIHVAEGMIDVEDSLANYGCRPAERLYKHGILGPKTLLGHCIHLTDDELDLIRDTDTMTVNNPGSNMNNAVGCAPVLKMLGKGILTGLGTDAFTHDMLESLKCAVMIQRHVSGLPNVAFGEALRMLLTNNRLIAGRYFEKPLGILKEGAAADIIVMDYKPFTPLLPENIGGHMMFGLEGKNCRTTIINGKVLYKDREFVLADEDRINAWTMEQSKKLWGVLNHRTY